MLSAQLGDITKANVDYICNAANGIGPMGRGVAGAIRNAGGNSIQYEAFKVCKEVNPREGEVYVTNAGSLPYKKIIHLVTMKSPGGPTSNNIVRLCLLNLIHFCNLYNITSVALPALGTGVGGLDKKEVADIYKEVLSDNNYINFLVVDINKEFISYFNQK